MGFFFGLCFDRITMPFKYFVEVGRVVFLDKGPHAEKLAVIVDVIDGTRALIDGPCSDVPRQEYRFGHLQLTKWVVKIQRGESEKCVREAWEEADIDSKWSNSTWAKNLEKRAKRKSLTDYDRFKLGRAKQARNRIVNRAFKKLKKEEKYKAKKAKEASA